MNLMTTDEAATILKCDRDYICFLIRTGQLEGARVARRYLTSEEAVKRFFDSVGEMKSHAAFERAAAKTEARKTQKIPA